MRKIAYISVREFFNIFHKILESTYDCSGTLFISPDFLFMPLKRFGGQILNFAEQNFEFYHNMALHTIEL